ncbi:hypothetical protein [Aquimarina algicola]|uniref:Uncharacterized protein n=1 Tax=Aquimarina algicola TaxID=2589995 RepID=A0A504J4R1_9FLAO|nr:hypothetical protein [Aquimarina algicola]TPN85797.1 hypothetical protein FHK87_10940 [Aquimarina algicola]
MIAGETESLLSDHFGEEYDDFLFGNKEQREKRKAARIARRKVRRSARVNKRKARQAARAADPVRIERQARRIARKTDPSRIERRTNFFSRLGEAYRGLGGGAAIGGAVDSLLRKPIPIQSPGQPPKNSDYNFGLQNPDRMNDRRERDRNNNTPLIVAGVVVVLALGGVMLYKSNQNSNMQIPKR